MVKSAARVLTLLELFDAQRRPLRVSEISELLGTPQSSTSMLLKTLVAGGYMEHDGQERSYFPSPRIAFMGNWVIQSPGRQEQLSELMRQLSQATGETVLLGRRCGLQLQYLSIVDSDSALRFSPAPGTLRPLHRTAIGIVLMGQMADAQIGLLMRSFNAQRAKDQAAVKPAELMRAIDFAREHRYYESAGSMTPGAGVIAALLPRPLRGVQLGIGIGAPVDRLHRKRGQLLPALLQVVHAAARGE